MDDPTVSGRCLCGTIAFQYAGAPNWTVHCHCESCRRATSCPMTTWISVPRSAFALPRACPVISILRQAFGAVSARSVGHL